jgi:hypothetical protein
LVEDLVICFGDVELAELVWDCGREWCIGGGEGCCEVWEFAGYGMLVL